MKYITYLTDFTQKGKIMRFNANLRISEKTCGSKPAARHKLHLNVGLTLRKVSCLLFILAFISCGKKAEVTWDSALYSDPELKNKIADVKKGTIGVATSYRNHKWVAKESIEIAIDGKQGFISPKHVVIGQNPAKSVFVWGYSDKYKKFFDPSDKKHYKEGYEFPDLAKLPKDKLPLDSLIKDSIAE